MKFPVLAAVLAAGLMSCTPAYAADVKISQMPDASALGGTEMIPVVQSGANRKATPAQIATYTLGGSVAVSAFGRSLLDDADAAAGRTTLGLPSANLTWGGTQTWTNATLSQRASAVSTMHDVVNTNTAGNVGGFWGAFHDRATSMASGNTLGGLIVGGTSAASTLRNSGGLTGYASQAWADGSAYGTDMCIERVLNGATSRTAGLCVRGSGVTEITGSLTISAPLGTSSGGTGKSSFAVGVDYGAPNTVRTTTADSNVTHTPITHGNIVLDTATLTSSRNYTLGAGPYDGYCVTYSTHGAAFGAFARLIRQPDGSTTVLAISGDEQAVICWDGGASLYRVASYASRGPDRTLALASDVTTVSTSFAAVTGLGSYVPGATYAVEARVYFTADGTSGMKYRWGGSATISAILWSGKILCTAGTGAGTLVALNRYTDTSSGFSTAGCTAGWAELAGTITVSASGTLQVQFGLSTGSSTLTALTSSTLTIKRVAS